MAGNNLNLIGQKFNKLTVVGLTNERNRRYKVWLCKCDCGNIHKVDTGHIRVQKSCGCLQGENKRLPYQEASFNGVFRRYKQSAKEREYSFELTKEQFKELTSKNCFYCERKPEQCQHRTRNKNGTYYYNGLDRINNDLGYVLSNVVPCCAICNRAKDTMIQEEFLDWIKTVCKNLELRK